MDQDRRLAEKLALTTRQLQWEVAAMQFQLATRQLRDALVELRYNPDQPRVPAGNLGGGQWTDDGSGRSAVAGGQSAGVRPTSMLVAATTRNFNYACKRLELDRKEASAALHAAKEKIEMGEGDDLCEFDLETGDIFYHGEWQGNLRD